MHMLSWNKTLHYWNKYKTMRVLYLARKHFDAVAYAGCKYVPMEAIKDEKVGKSGKKLHKKIVI